MPIFVISLPSASRRREHMQRQLDAIGVRWEFVDAIDGTQLGHEAFAAIAREAMRALVPGRGRPMTAGEVGCALSHQRCYQLVLERAFDAALILEDDVAVPPTLPLVLRELSTVATDWELVLLGHHSARHGPLTGAETTWQRWRLGNGRSIGRPVEFAMGAMAYVVRNSGARKLLDYGTPVRMPADWLTGYAPSASVRSYLMAPPIAWSHQEISQPSTMPGREPAVAVDARTSASVVWRKWASDAWLLLRKAGILPSAFSRRY